VHGPDEPWLLTPDDVRELRAFAESRRRDPSIPFDVALTAGAYDDEGERRETIAALDEAGATWWIEYVPPADVDEMRREIEAGPRPA
jgi:hypothetical protein